MIRITEYAEDLLEGLTNLKGWDEKVNYFLNNTNLELGKSDVIKLDWQK